MRRTTPWHWTLAECDTRLAQLADRMRRYLPLRLCCTCGCLAQVLHEISAIGFDVLQVLQALWLEIRS